jgi:hypothetical protein
MSSGCDLAGCKITAALLSKPTMGNCLPKWFERRTSTLWIAQFWLDIIGTFYAICNNDVDVNTPLCETWESGTFDTHRALFLLSYSHTVCSHGPKQTLYNWSLIQTYIAFWITMHFA